MALYMYQASYTAKSMAAQLTEPRDPVEAMRSALEDLGAEIVVAGFPFGEYDVLVVYEAPDDMTAASVAMAVAAEGEVKSAKTTRLLSGQEWLESLRKRRIVNARKHVSHPAASQAETTLCLMSWQVVGQEVEHPGVGQLAAGGLARDRPPEAALADAIHSRPAPRRPRLPGHQGVDDRGQHRLPVIAERHTSLEQHRLLARAVVHEHVPTAGQRTARVWRPSAAPCRAIVPVISIYA
jgi:uncharacterized protein with GYD domain